MHNDETRGEDAAIPTTPARKQKATRTRAPSAPYRHGKGYAIRRSHNGHDIFLSGFKTTRAAEKAMNRRVEANSSGRPWVIRSTPHSRWREREQ